MSAKRSPFPNPYPRGTGNTGLSTKQACSRTSVPQQVPFPGERSRNREHRKTQPNRRNTAC